MREHGVSTMNKLFRMFVWSLAACLYNRHPVLDWDDRPWTDQPNAELRKKWQTKSLMMTTCVLPPLG